MPTMKFTDLSVRAIKPRAMRLDYFDTDLPGFGLRVTPTGVKSWTYMYRVGRRLRRWTLGRYPALGLADARKRARIASGGLLQATPVDPAAEKTETRRDTTVGELAKDYMQRHAKVKKRTWKADQWKLDKDVLPRWKHALVKDVTRQMVSDLLWDIANPEGRNAPQSAVHVRRLLSKMFEFAIAQGAYGIEHNPVTRSTVPAKPGKRDRVLTDDEIVHLWLALDAEWEAGYPRTASWLRLILLTLQRPGEVLKMEWSRIDLGTEWWTLEQTKNGHPVEVALNAEAVAVLRTLKAWSDARHEEVEANMNGRRETRALSRHVFPARTRVDGDHHMRAMLSHACDRVRTRSSVDFKPHDLRRTAATLLGKLGVNRFIVQRVLNHTDSSVTGIYETATRTNPKRWQRSRSWVATSPPSRPAERRPTRRSRFRMALPLPDPLEKMSNLTYPDVR